MSLLDRFRREPDERLVIRASPSLTSAEAMAKMARFSKLMVDHKLDLVDAKPTGEMTVQGRPKNVAAFKITHTVLAIQNLV